MIGQVLAEYLGDILLRRGKFEEAERVFHETVDLQRRLYKGDHPYLALSLQGLARAKMERGNAIEAEPLFLEAWEMDKHVLKSDDPYMAFAMQNLAECWSRLGRQQEALKLAQQAADICARALPESHRIRVNCDETLARIKEKIRSSKLPAAPAEAGE
jgi:tetratricopeptide (TPR) repeat protein